MSQLPYSHMSQETKRGTENEKITQTKTLVVRASDLSLPAREVLWLWGYPLLPGNLKALPAT